MNKKVKCIDKGNNSFITVGKVYKVVDCASPSYKLINDEGSELWYLKSLFVDFVPDELEEISNSLKKAIDDKLIDAIIKGSSALVSFLEKDKFNNPKQGQIWINTTTGDNYILAKITYDTYALINLNGGNRYSSPVVLAEIFKGESPNRWKLKD